MASQGPVLDIVCEDLHYLRTEWWGDLTDAALRRGSTVLRRLLVHGDLQRAWRAGGHRGEPSIIASTLSPLLQRVPLDRIAFASAGGAHYNGMEIRGALMVNYAMSKEQVQAAQSGGFPTVTCPLAAYAGAPALIVEGQQVPRRLVVKYVANKLGGAHHDTGRGSSKDETYYRLLDKVADTELAEKKAVYFELLSAGQALATSPDLRSLCP